MALLLSLILVYSCALTKEEKVKDRLTKPNKFTELKLESSCGKDPIISEIKQELSTKTSVLDLMIFYLEQLKEETNIESSYLQKLERLFVCGLAKERVEGHFYGITIVLKKGNHPYGVFLNQVWSNTLGDVSPWVGKIFSPVGPKELAFYTEDFEKGNVPTYLGINCFQQIDESLLNKASMIVLIWWMDLKEAPKEERLKYGYDKKGGLFIARMAKSVDPKTPNRYVFQLNYRWKRLDNPIPLKYLIDEIVEIADGLYLGKLLFATDYLLQDYNPRLDISKYKYENFGYFLLMDDKWNKEKNISIKKE